MNANELADELESRMPAGYWTPPELLAEAATMLRQQQAEIEALKAENRVLRKMELWLGMVYNNRGNGIAPMYLENFMSFCETNGFTEESGYKLFKAQLTDEEKWKLWGECPNGLVYDRVMLFADLILRKAQEK